MNTREASALRQKSADFRQERAVPSDSNIFVVARKSIPRRDSIFYPSLLIT
jgi:hypothetical protein